MFAFCASRASRASSGRRPDSCGQHLLKNQRQTGGLSSIPHRRDSPPTTNAGRCAFAPVGEGPFRTRQEEWTEQGGKAPGWFFNSPNARGIDATDEDQFRPGRKELLRRPGRGSAGTGPRACPWSRPVGQPQGGAVPAINRSSFLVAPIFFRDYSAKDAKGYRGRIHAARFGVGFGATVPQRPSATAAIPVTVTHTPQTRRGRTRVMSRSMRTVKMTEKIGIEAMMGPTTLTSELMMARL